MHDEREGASEARGGAGSGGVQEVLSALQARIGYVFADLSLLERALTHRSYANESSVEVRDNQRLEFLGDAVLGMVVTEAIFERYPGYSEGSLSKLKAQLVCEATLAEIAGRLGLGEALRLGRGEEASGGRRKPSLLADAYEALVAAIHLDRGVSQAREFVLRHHSDALSRITSPVRVRDAKSRLQELVQRERGVRPRYEIVSVEGPDHAREFTAEAVVGDEVVGRGVGRSKKEAQQAAAAAALGESWSADGAGREAPGTSGD